MISMGFDQYSCHDEEPNTEGRSRFPSCQDASLREQRAESIKKASQRLSELASVGDKKNVSPDRYMTAQAFLSDVESCIQSDAWSGDLIRAGFIRALLSFFRKTMLFLCALEPSMNKDSDVPAAHRTREEESGEEFADVFNTYVSGSVLQVTE
jgi:hypothetical protein